MKRTFSEASAPANPVPTSSPSTRSTSPTTSITRSLTSPGSLTIPHHPPPPSAVATIFNMGRIPTISRKVRACAACKKQKIRCEFEERQQTCVRCKKMGLECVVNRSLQTILDEDVEWKHKIREDTAQLQRAVEEILAAMQMRPLASYGVESPTASRASSEPPEVKVLPKVGVVPKLNGLVPPPRRSEESTARVKVEEEHLQQQRMVRDHTQSPDEHDDPLFSNPMGSLYEVTRLRGLRGSIGSRLGTNLYAGADFITRGLIAIEDAKELFLVFREDLNPYLYNMALVHDDLETTRNSSSLLTSAIFTVAALHVPQHHHLFPTLYHEFLGAISSCMFDRFNRLDDVRGLCIGAFWLMEISWKLSGHAVRIATEMGIHLSFRKAVAGNRECFEQARLWYLLYVCDHHFSIAYGRPPVIHDHEPMRQWELYLQSPLSIEGDTRLLCQVSLFVVMTRIYYFYEDEAESEVPEDRLSHLHIFNEQIDNWKNTWRPRIPEVKTSRSYCMQTLNVHYHFARLQLNALALRGASPGTIRTLSPLRKTHAAIAISSASAVLQIVLSQGSPPLLGVPLYFNTMVAFAAVFLLKVSADPRWGSIAAGVPGGNEAWEVVYRIVDLLNETSQTACESHIVPHVAKGLTKMREKCAVEYGWGQQQQQQEQGQGGEQRREVERGSGEAEEMGYWGQYHQQNHNPMHEEQPPAGTGPGTGGLLFPPSHSTPQHHGQEGQDVFEVGQYIPPIPVPVPVPVQLGVFDFLSPQLPY